MPDSPAPITRWTRAFNQQHAAFQLHFAGKVRMTRDLSQLQHFVADVSAMRAQAAAEAHASEGRWQALLDLVDRRIETYATECAAVAQIQAAATVHDRRASVLTARARLVLHRYVRHFAGLSRRNRDLARFAEIRSDLEEVVLGLQPLATTLHTRPVAEEVAAVRGFVEFLAAEHEELKRARDTGSLLDRSENLRALAADLEAAWQREVVPVPRVLRRPGLLQRYASGLDDLLEGLMQVRHANLPDAHEQATHRTAALLGKWQDELAAVERLRGGLDGVALLGQLLDHGEALAQPWLQHRELWTASDRQQLGQWADALDETERQVAALASEGLPGGLQRRWAWLRDVLVSVERDYDSTAQ